MRLPKALIITTNPPLNTAGGSLLFYRQFVQRDDYEIAVMTDRYDEALEEVPWMQVRHPRWLQRLVRTRFSLFGHDYIHLIAGRFPKGRELEFAQEFSPDIIVAGAETWMADLALSIGRKLDVPVAGFFMDWPTYASIAHPLVKRRLSKVFRRRYVRCELAFCISPEMMAALGRHPNAHVYYPSDTWQSKQVQIRSESADPYTLFFGGNLGQWYGKAITRLIKALCGKQGFKLQVAGLNEPWSEKETERLSAEGTFLGFLKGQGYLDAIAQADALLVIMGFEEESRIIESTSFKSKIVDYLKQQRPLIVWGPDYCTAVKHAKKHGFGLVVTDENPAGVVKALEQLKEDPELRGRLVENGEVFFKNYLDSEGVFGKCLSLIKETIQLHASNPSREEARGSE